MTDDEFDTWLKEFSRDQILSLSALRSLILKYTDELIESISEGKWLHGFVFYSIDSKMVYAIGPKGKSKTTLHMMPYYGSLVLQERHQAALSPFLSGKSCLAFQKYSDIPIDSLINILDEGTPTFLRTIIR